MELHHYIALILQKKLLVAAIIVGALAATCAFTLTRNPSFLTSSTIGITTSEKQQTPDYQYDGYYAIQASELFSDTVTSWAESPDVIVNVFDKAGIAAPTQNIKKLAKIFTANKLSAQNVEIRFTTDSEETAKKLVSGLQQAFDEKTKTINDASKGSTSFQLVFSDAVTKEAAQNLALNLLIGLVVGTIVALGVVIMLNYLHEDRN